MLRHAASAALTALTLAPAAAGAQWSASAGIDSQRVFRGLSLSDGQPSPHAALNIDAAHGGYAGASVARVMLVPGQASTQWTAHAGWSGPVDAHASWHASWHWELGLTGNHFSADRDEDYADVFMGLLADDWTLRLHEAPNYFGQGLHMLYVEWDGARELTSGVHAVAHLGVQHPHHGASTSALRQWQADWRLGIAAQWRDLALQCAWFGAQRWADASYSAYAYAAPSLSRPRSPWQLSIDLAF